MNRASRCRQNSSGLRKCHSILDPRTIRYQRARSYYVLGSLELIRSTTSLGVPKFFATVLAVARGNAPTEPEVEAALEKFDEVLALIPTAGVPQSEPDALVLLERDTSKMRAVALAMLGRLTEALVAINRAERLADGIAKEALVKYRRLFLAAAEVEQSRMPWSRPGKLDHNRAIRMADVLLAQPEVSDPAIFNAACAFSLASADEAAGADEHEHRAARAVALLEQIEGRGYFRALKPAEELRTDSDLSPIRPRAKFRALLNRVRPGS